MSFMNLMSYGVELGAKFGFTLAVLYTFLVSYISSGYSLSDMLVTLAYVGLLGIIPATILGALTGAVLGIMVKAGNLLLTQQWPGIGLLFALGIGFTVSTLVCIWFFSWTFSPGLYLPPAYIFILTGGCVAGILYRLDQKEGSLPYTGYNG